MQQPEIAGDQRILAASAPDAALDARLLPSLQQRSMRLLRRHQLGAVGALLIAGFVVVALTATALAPHNPRAFVGPPLSAPSRGFPFGTNNLGQDVLSRTIYGAQISFAIGLGAVVVGTTAGTLLGLLAGYFGGWLDMVIQRGAEILASFPGLMLALVVVAALGSARNSSVNVFVLAWQLRVVVLAVSLSFIFGVIRLIRSAVIAQRHAAYVEAAQSCGARWPRILGVHILPNVMPYVIVTATTIIGLAILLEASLSFLGYGVAPGTPSWGVDVSSRNREFFLQAPWTLVAPGAAISLTVFGFNLLGDSLRDLLDPRLRGG